MHGEIGVESEAAGGSTFWFTVRCTAAEPPLEEVHLIGLDEACTRPSAGLRVLVAEDNQVNQQLLRALLCKRGHHVDVVDNGAKAVAAVKTDVYDVVLMDIQMPEMDGPTATRLIRKLDGPEGRVPIIAVTANAMHGQREEYLAAGMDDYVTKPIKTAALFAAIAKATRKGQAAGTALQVTKGRSSCEPTRSSAVQGKQPVMGEVVGGLGLAETEPVFDDTTLVDLRGCLEDDELRAALAAIPLEAGTCLNQIKAAIAAGDLDTARRAAHMLKGMAGNLGAVRLAAAARRLELAAAASEAVAQQIAPLERALDATRARLGSMA